MWNTMLLAAQHEAEYHPHGVCYLWEADLVWTHVAGDGFTALAYYSIPLGLIYFVRKRRDVPFDWIFVAFAIFILACGTTHVMAIWTLWNPDFWVSAWVKVVTAGASVATAALMIPLLPKALELPSPAQLREKNEKLREAHRQITALNGELATKIASLEAANADLRTFAYSMSHDLKAPLRAMEGFSAALIEDCGSALDERCEDYARRVAAGSRRMSHLIDDLLDYSSLALKDLPVGRVELRAVIDEVVSSLQPTAEEMGATVVTAIDDTEVAAHRGTVTTILTNLLTNALTYVDEARRPRVEIRVEPVDGAARVTVVDNGLGIQAEHRERIFKVFERLHGVEQYGGTGIGLAVVSKGMERMGGRFGVRSEVGEGSEFWIELPRWSVS